MTRPSFEATLHLHHVYASQENMSKQPMDFDAIPAPLPTVGFDLHRLTTDTFKRCVRKTGAGVVSERVS